MGYQKRWSPIYCAQRDQQDQRSQGRTSPLSTSSPCRRSIDARTGGGRETATAYRQRKRRRNQPLAGRWTQRSPKTNVNLPGKAMGGRPGQGDRDRATTKVAPTMLRMNRLSRPVHSRVDPGGRPVPVALHVRSSYFSYFFCTGAGSLNDGEVLPLRFAASAFKRSTDSKGT